MMNLITWIIRRERKYALTSPCSSASWADMGLSTLPTRMKQIRRPRIPRGARWAGDRRPEEEREAAAQARSGRACGRGAAVGKEGRLSGKQAEDRAGESRSSRCFLAAGTSGEN
jgi:hypothetical protein